MRWRVNHLNLFLVELGCFQLFVSPSHFSLFNCCLSIVLQLDKGDHPKIHMLCFVLINSVLFSLLCVWIFFFGTLTVILVLDFHVKGVYPQNCMSCRVVDERWLHTGASMSDVWPNSGFNQILGCSWPQRPLLQ